MESAATACEKLLRKLPKETMALRILGAVRLCQNWSSLMLFNYIYDANPKPTSGLAKRGNRVISAWAEPAQNELIGALPETWNWL